MGKPGMIVGAGKATLEICAPTAVAPPFEERKLTTCQPGGISMSQPAVSW